MKSGTRKIVYTILAVLLALGLGIGAILLSMLNVQASSEMMPGIEQIIDEKSNEAPFRILELVNRSSDAEIGYYISGQEPYLSQYTYTPDNADGTKGESQTFSSVEEGLSVLPTAQQRKEFVEGSSDMVKNPLDLSWKVNNPGTTKEEDYPLSFKSYAEKYFLSKTDDSAKWNRVDFKESRKVKLKGHYEENASGTGDYTKEEQQYYPIREDVATDGSSTQKYRENVKNFFYSDDTEAQAPYQLSFEPVANEDVNNSLSGDEKDIDDAYDYSNGGFGYYENVYSELTSEITDNIADKKYTFPGENPTVSETETPDTNMGGEDDETVSFKNDETAGTQENPYIYRGENIDEHPYYKYTLIGDLEAVKAKAEECAGTTERKDGDITLESDQYWYWTEENTDNGDESDSDEGTDAAANKDTESGTSAESNTESEADTSESDAQAAEESETDESGDNGVSAQADSDGTDVVLKKEALYIVTGRQAVSLNQVRAIPDDFKYDYYYKVSSVDYCCKLSDQGEESDPEDYTYYGWYYASHPSNEDTYIEVKDAADGTTEDSKLSDVLNYTATHYISAAQYTLTPGKGNYDFIQDESDSEKTVELDHLFYQGGYTNHDWFKKYVFHLDPDSTDETIQKQFKNLSMKVDTKIINSDSDIDLSDLSDYDLVYINGELTTGQAQKVASNTKVPVILNQKKISADVVNDAFEIYVDEDYENTQYVSERIYFTTGDIFNLKFHAELTGTDLDGFSEITSYIKSENNYRELIESGENGEKTDPLSEEITQARVIEYIINYQYKRKVAYKDTVNVLDIEPASASATITEDNVRTWLGLNGNTESGEEKERGTIKDYCCQERKNNGENAGEGSNGGIDKILDGDASTYWHSAYSKDAGEIGKTPHWFEYELSSQDRARTLTGIRFTAKSGRNNGELNGRPYKLKFEIHKVNGSVITETATFSDTTEELKQWYTANYQKEYTFQNPVKNVDYIKVIFIETYSNPKGGKATEFATCAEFSTLYKSDQPKDTKINITNMTSSEFVGHIDDINTEYDAIYFGDSYNNWSFLRNGDVDDNNKKTSLYAHIGGVFGGDKDPENVTTHRSWNVRLMGLLNDDYSSSTQLRSSVKANLPTNLQNKIGLMRGSGNDITKQQVEELNDFVSSGYPIIVGDGLLNADKKSVNTNVVDSSSYMYQFINKAITSDKVNIMSKSEADKKQNLNFFFYLAKPEISFKELPPEPVRLNDSNYKYNKEAGTGTLGKDEEGLSYTFTIDNKSEISTATATYNCELFIDLNFDGNLSSSEEQAEYIQIQDANKNVVRKENGKYHLKIGKEYTLTRKIPKDYYKVISWKIQISNNDNPSIRTSRMGYAKREPEKQQSIKVLQIYPKQNKNDAPVTWNLEEDTDFLNMLAQVKDFNITVDAMQTRTYEKKFKEYQDRGENLLDNYQMIIIGFADGFGVDTISNNNGEVNAIRKFIEAGKSVIFAHDTTSFINRDTDKVSPPSGMPATWIWGYTLNTYLRASVGMDRYGITSDQAITVDGKQSTVSAELKKGNDLSAKSNVFKAIQDKVSDMAYMFGNKETTSLMTQGFSNNVLYHVNGVQGTEKASKINEGAITQYPYHTSDKITTATTHSQYYQLALEEDSDGDGTNDIVVWYCLADGDSTYKNSPNDVRNNYYFYSKGNVIYTGVGHRGNGQEGKHITNEERQLFANAIVAAANVTAVEPEATFIEDFDPTADEEDYRYYMPDRLRASELSGNESNILSGNNQFNIRVRDYNMVASNLNYNDNNAGSLSMELYIEDPNGTEMTINGAKVKVSKLSTSDRVSSLKKYSDGETIHVSDGKFKLPGNDTFQFELKDMESYLKQSDGTYKKNCRIFAKIESTVTLYGTTANKETWTSIGLRPRQLFDLD